MLTTKQLASHNSLVVRNARCAASLCNALSLQDNWQRFFLLPIGPRRFHSLPFNSFPSSAVANDKLAAIKPFQQTRHHTLAARTRAKFLYHFSFLRGYKPATVKPRVVILGTGWSSMHLLKYLNLTRFDVVVVSPRNYFTFTPLLPSVAAGTLSPLSCLEPVRNFTRSSNRIAAEFHEAAAIDVDVEKQRVTCVSEDGDQFDVCYDYLVVGVGSDTNTFGTPGVETHALFLKEVEHAIRLRKVVMNNFERASLPSTTEEEKSQLLHIVAVGGGPTGVETMAELSDFIKEDMARYFPELMKYVRLTLVEMGVKVLPMFSSRVSQYTLRTLLRHQRVNVLLQHRVTRVRRKSIEITSGNSNKVVNLPYGVLLWATGVQSTAFGNKLASLIPEQNGLKVLETDAQLKLKGTTNIYAMGDCKRICPPLMKEEAEMFVKANGGQIPSSEWFRKQAKYLRREFPQISKNKYNFWRRPIVHMRNEAQLIAYLDSIDKNYKPPAATAQNARQEGLYLACLLNEFGDNDNARADYGYAFVDRWWGSLAYVGNGRAVASLRYNLEVQGGWFSFPLWKTLYLIMQLSMRSRFVVSFDWFKVWSCGRDVGRDHVYIPGETIQMKKNKLDSDKQADEDEKDVVISTPLQRAISTKILDIS